MVRFENVDWEDVLIRELITLQWVNWAVACAKLRCATNPRWTRNSSRQVSCIAA